MNVTEGKALRERMREAKENLDREFNAAWEALGAAIQPHAQQDTNRVYIPRTESDGYSSVEMKLVEAASAAGKLETALTVARDEVMRAGMNLPSRMGEVES